MFCLAARSIDVVPQIRYDLNCLGESDGTAGPRHNSCLRKHLFGITLLMISRQCLHLMINKAALDPTAWRPLVETLLDAFRGDGGGLNIANPVTGQSLQSLDYGIPDCRHEQYYSEVYRYDPRIPAMVAMPSGTAFADSQLFDSAEIDHHPFYAWQAEFGYRHTLLVKLLHDRQQLGAIAITRRVALGAPSADELAIARDIAPALAHAAEVNRRISMLRSIQNGLETSIRANAQAFGLIDLSANVIHATGRFASILCRRDGLTTSKGRLRAQHPRSVACLERALGRALVDGQGSALSIERTTQGRPYRLVIEPLRKAAAECADFTWGQSSGAYLFLDDPDDIVIGARSVVLQKIHGLTPAEANVAEAIAMGMSPEEIADLSNSRISTVRTHVKRIFIKLDVSRMSSLASLVLRLPAQVNSDEP